ncbi:hypothetical protein MKW94_004364 [Papaver nudicaule]|uniref:Protein FLUORESCENT IN BLUE LIGHT, chloroplastic n=1 Tax=Papaver nudicaule TaxID=74823 RepID=A0AA42AYT2_PAPNU|nr:hypothetical protein [Papaver nudicaule]
MALHCTFSRPSSSTILMQSQPQKSHGFSKPKLMELLPAGKSKILEHLNAVNEFLKLEKVHGLGISVSADKASSRKQLPFQTSKTLVGLLDVKNLLVHQGTEQYNFPLSAVLFANTMMLGLPFPALAETCETERSLFEMPLLLTVALVGAVVGGLLARQRKGELKKLNDQLRQINAALRKQAKIESYAPTLSYSPVGINRIPEEEVIVDSKKHELMSNLKTGKNFLRTQEPGKAYESFKTALELAQSLKDPIEEKKAARGLGASLQRLGKYKEAIKYHSLVLEISDREREESGNTEAYGAIADCYTELGELEQAGKFYDKYIMRLED